MLWGHIQHQINLEMKSEQVQHTGQHAQSWTSNKITRCDTRFSNRSRPWASYTNNYLTIMNNQFKSRDFSLSVSRFIRITHLSTTVKVQSYVQYIVPFVTNLSQMVDLSFKSEGRWILLYSQGYLNCDRVSILTMWK